MKKTQNINIEWLTRLTGDPFADIGGIVIKMLFRRKKHEDIQNMIKDVTRVYVNDWNAKLNAFFLNSTITQPAFKGSRKTEETINFFEGLLNDSKHYEEGYCRILGEKTKLFSAGRDNHILSGSGTFINYHHAFQNGLMLSKEALIRMFFVPLGCVQLSDKIALLYSNDSQIVEYFASINIEENLRRSSTKISDGIYRWPYKTPSSALFDFALCWIREAKNSSLENVELNLYHFTNFGASPEVILHNFSSALFKFYKKVLHRTLKNDWERFAHAHFYQKNTRYDYDTNTFEVTAKKEKSTFAYEEFKSWRNRIYDDLLAGKSILRPMLKWVSQKQCPLNFEIVKLYQIILRDMNEKTLQIIDRIADYVLEDSSNIKKNLRNLQKPKKSYAFRTALRRLEEKNLQERKPTPLFSLEEYALELFPDGTYWQEIQDLLLIAIYQKMHEQEIWLDDSEILFEEEQEEKIN